ncbi:MAG TPA: hypothetical protein VL523_13285 [Terriglobia bacterium]|nr:hypothetical protein [Terriglobia bacterium]
MGGAHVALEDPRETPLDQGETSEPQLAEEVKSPVQTLHVEAAIGEQPGPEKALVEALRGFIRKETRQKEDESPQKIGVYHAVALLLFAVDLALLYSQFQHALENPLFQEILKVAPWALGATAVGFADRVRKMLVDQARHMKWVIVGAAILVPLLLLQTPIFSMRLRVNTQSVTVTPDDQRVHSSITQENNLYRVVFPDWNGYELTLKDTYNEDSAPFKFKVGGWRMLKGTLAQIPVAGGLFGRKETMLTPLYYVRTDSAQGGAQVDVEGWFQAGFLDAASLSRLRCTRIKASDPKHQAVQCSVAEGIDKLKLPKGWYDLTLRRGNCQKPLPRQEVKESGNRGINFDERCKD